MDLVGAAAHPRGPQRRPKADENEVFGGASCLCVRWNGLTYSRTEGEELRNEKALSVYNRVQSKLTGRDFNTDPTELPLSVPAQVDKLIIQATSLENLCQCFSGW